jgi:Lipocalin-like domain/CrtC N-terminal lipocalin domain
MVSWLTEHTLAEYPVVRGSSPRAGWRRLVCAFTASTASALAILLVTAAPNGAKAQASAPSMIPPAAQAVAASGASKGAPLFVAADPDLVAKEGVAQDSWFVVSHLTSGSNRLDLLVHYIRLTPPQGPVIQAIVSVLDPVSGKSLAEEKDYKASETTFSAASLDVRTPTGGLTGRASGMHLTGQFLQIQLDLMLAQQGPLLANLGTGLIPFYGDINYEYALPNMKTAGSVVVDGKRYQVDGVSWFDRQWGQMAPSFWAHKQWSWMGISLDNGDRISLWDIIDGDKEHAFATLLHPDGRHEIVDVEPLAKGATSVWTSAATGHRYPTHWVVSMPMLKTRLRVEPLVREQEVVSPIGVNKYEGASKVAGQIEGKPVTGHAVVELVGDWT